MKTNSISSTTILPTLQGSNKLEYKVKANKVTSIFHRKYKERNTLNVGQDISFPPRRSKCNEIYFIYANLIVILNKTLQIEFPTQI